MKASQRWPHKAMSSHNNKFHNRGTLAFQLRPCAKLLMYLTEYSVNASHNALTQSGSCRYVCRLKCSSGWGMRPRPSLYAAPRRFICTQAHDSYPTRHGRTFYSIPIYHLDINIWFYSYRRHEQSLLHCITSAVN